MKLRDEEHRLTSEEARLTFAAFDTVFPGFPIYLDARPLYALANHSACSQTALSGTSAVMCHTSSSKRSYTRRRMRRRSSGRPTLSLARNQEWADSPQRRFSHARLRADHAFGQRAGDGLPLPPFRANARRRRIDVGIAPCPLEARQRRLGYPSPLTLTHSSPRRPSTGCWRCCWKSCSPRRWTNAGNTFSDAAGKWVAVRPRNG